MLRDCDNQSLADHLRKNPVNGQLMAEAIARLIEALVGKNEKLTALLQKCREKIEAFMDPENNMPEDTGEFRELKAVWREICEILPEKAADEIPPISPFPFCRKSDNVR